MLVLKGGAVAKKITEELAAKVQTFQRPPKLSILRLTEDGGAVSYETGARKRMEKIGIACDTIVLPADISNDDFLAKIRALNEEEGVDGILVLKPLPKQINEEALNEILSPEKDVDCITKENRLRLFEDRAGIRPCTPEAVLEVIRHYGYSLTGKNVTVVGRSMVIGKPVAFLLLKENATVTICHSKTASLPEVCRKADILVTAIGRAKMFTPDYTNENQIILDVGINVDENGNLCGDVDYEAVADKVQAITPVPGGIGSVTTAVLAKHTVEAYEKKCNR